jgi:hypothetical protein
MLRALISFAKNMTEMLDYTNRLSSMYKGPKDLAKETTEPDYFFVYMRSSDVFGLGGR